MLRLAKNLFLFSLLFVACNHPQPVYLILDLVLWEMERR